ncbi:MAG: SufD family Fe-S cluster assembly protein [Candidatus Aenigmatarchaeota archaeon]
MFDEKEIFKYNDLFSNFDLENYIKNIKKVNARKIKTNIKNLIVISNNKIENCSSIKLNKNFLIAKNFNDNLNLLVNPSSMEKNSLSIKFINSKSNFQIYLMDSLESLSYQNFGINLYFLKSDVNISMLSFSNEKRVKLVEMKNFLKESKVNLDLSIFDNFSKFKISSTLLTKNSSININGISFSVKQSKLDFFSEVKCLKPYSIAHLNFRSLLFDESNIILKGLIFIKKDAINCDTFLSMHSLKASNKCSSQILPMLCVENNEVKAMHNASSSYIDEEKVFYLSSRGIDENQARFLIAEGFLKYLIKKMKNKNFVDLNLAIIEKIFQRKKIEINDVLNC